MYQIFKTGVYTLSALSFLALASCSNSVTEEPKSEQAKQENLVPLTLQAELDLDESARSLVYTLDQKGGFQYKLKDGVVKVFTVLRTKDSKKPIYSAVLDWKTDVKNNKLVLSLLTGVGEDVYKALEEDEWYASCAFSNALVADGQQRGDLLALQSNGLPASTQKFSVSTGSPYEKTAEQFTNILVKPQIRAMSGYAGHVVSSPDLVDYNGIITNGTEAQKIPALYIMPWTKITVTGARWRPAVSQAISYTETIDTKKTIKFSGTLKPIGTVVRAKLQTAPATYEMLDKSPNTDDIKAYVNDAKWSLGQVQIYTKAEGTYNFAGNLVVGQVPAFSPDPESTFRNGPRTPQKVGFNAPTQDIGTIYFWTQDPDFSVSYTIDHPYKQGTASSVTTPSTGYYLPYSTGVPNDNPQPGMATIDTRMIYSPSMRVSTPGITETKMPIYPSTTKTAAADAKWKSLFNMSPYAFDSDVTYPRKTITGLKGGYTKEITIRIKPHIKNARRVTLEKFTYSGPI